jgi:hypothetical protein
MAKGQEDLENVLQETIKNRLSAILRLGKEYRTLSEFAFMTKVVVIPPYNTPS